MRTFEYLSKLFREFIRQYKKSKEADKIDRKILQAIKNEQEKELEKLVEEFLEVHPTSPKNDNYPRKKWAGNVYYNVGTSCAREKKFHLAINMFEKAAEYFPSPHVYNNLAVCMKHQEEHEKAHEYLKKAIKIDPKYPSSYARMALFLKAYNPPVEDDPSYYLKKYLEKGGDKEKLKKLVNPNIPEEKKALEKLQA